MGLGYRTAAPEGVVEAARRTLRDLALNRAAGGAALAATQEFVTNVPLPVYILGLEHLGAGGGLADAKPVTWRMFVVNQVDDPVGVAEVRVADGAPRFVGYSRGPQVKSCGVALSEAADIPDSEGRYEPRFLDILGLNTSAIWLHNLDVGADRIVPVQPVPGFLRDRKSYTADEFLGRVQPQARAQLGFYDDPLGVAPKGS